MWWSKDFPIACAKGLRKKMVQSTLYEALKDNELVPAGTPYIEPEKLEQGKDFTYSAVFEVFPTLKLMN